MPRRTLQDWEDDFISNIDQDIVLNFDRTGRKVSVDRYWEWHIGCEAYIPVDCLTTFFKPAERKKWAKIQKDDPEEFDNECDRREHDNYMKMAKQMKKDVEKELKYLQKKCPFKFKVYVEEDDLIWLNVEFEIPPLDCGCDWLAGSMAETFMKFFSQ